MPATELIWLRNDLRLDDNPALYHGQQNGNIRVLFIASPLQWSHHNESPAKLGFKAQVIEHLAAKLATKGIEFDLLEVDLFEDISQTLLAFCLKHKIQTVWFNQECALDERQRDLAVKVALEKHHIHCHPLALDLLVPTPILNQQSAPYKVFTPFYKRWRELLIQMQSPPLPEPKQQGSPISHPPIHPSWAGEYRTDLWPAEEEKILEALSHFCEHKLRKYKQHRDFPSLPATSTLSPSLSIGQIGPRRLVDAIQFHCMQHNLSWQDNDWLRELAWRDFYRQLLIHFPSLNKNKPFKPETNQIKWREDNEGFEAWCCGKTGFPIIDAAMRQLIQTGWMHNRLRMLSASFLSKLLFIDWRLGENFFMSHLIDGEFAANNGGWQWSASTGCDAAPYFRIFNPITQSKTFDADGVFIRRFIPELRSLDNKSIHWPTPVQREDSGYPMAIIDYKLARQHAISSFAKLSE